MVKKKLQVAQQRRSNLVAEFKAKIALAALREDKTTPKRCTQYSVHSNHINYWKKQLIAHARNASGWQSAERIC